jgi:hypothetical protein
MSEIALRAVRAWSAVLNAWQLSLPLAIALALVALTVAPELFAAPDPFRWPRL